MANFTVKYIFTLQYIQVHEGGALFWKIQKGNNQFSVT